jgi:hypothetical protein
MVVSSAGRAIRRLDLRTQRRRRTPWLNAPLLCVLLVAWLPAQAEESPEASPYGGSLWSRSSLSGNWGGVRDQWAAKGLTINLDATYTFQGVVSGGFDGPLFARVSDEGDSGNDLSGTLTLELDTGKAGSWQGGFFNARLEGRAGRSVLQRAGSVSAVDNDALFPNVVDRFDVPAGRLVGAGRRRPLDPYRHRLDAARPDARAHHDRTRRITPNATTKGSP